MPYVISKTSAIVWHSSFAKSHPLGCFAILPINFVLALLLTPGMESSIINYGQDTNLGSTIQYQINGFFTANVLRDLYVRYESFADKRFENIFSHTMACLSIFIMASLSLSTYFKF
jgi:hypothetical protein